MKKLCVLLSCWVLVSCASMKKQGQEKVEAGQFEEAAALFEKALKEDPKDAEAQQGLARARSGILGNDLIAVRRARTSGNEGQALDLLLEVSHKEDTWKQYPIAQARFTQDEETDFAWPFMKGELSAQIQGKKPLVAEAEHLKYSPVFAGGKYATQYEALVPQIQAAGHASCQDLWRDTGPEVPYFTKFAASYCGHWKQDQAVPAQVEKARLADLYSSMDVSGGVQQLPAELGAQISKDLSEAFASSAWYNPDGARKAQLQLSGSYALDHQKNMVSLVYTYQANEPYEAVETITKKRDVPYRVMEASYDPAGTRKDVEVTRYKTEEYQEQQSVVKQRSVTKQFPYSALRHHQTIALNAVASAQLSGAPLTVTYINSGAAEGDEHDLNLPDIGLKPSRPQLLEPAAWVAKQSTEMRAAFAKKLSDEWIARNCNPSSASLTRAQLGDLAHKCRRDRNSGAPEFVNQWYQQNFGMNAAEAEAQLGIAAGG